MNNAAGSHHPVDSRGRIGDATVYSPSEAAGRKVPAEGHTVPRFGTLTPLAPALVDAAGAPAPARHGDAIIRRLPSKTSLLPLVRAFDWRAVADSLDDRPSLLTHRDERGRNWLHICCATPVAGRDAKPSIRTADVLLQRGIGLNAAAFTESNGRWQATPVWYSVAFGRNLKLTEHLLKKGAVPHYSLYAAAYNHDTAAIRLLVRYGADLEEPHGRGETPLLGAIGWSRFEAAEAMLACGANVNHQDDRGRTAAHLMLKKNSDCEHFAMLARYQARFDLPDATGTTAAEIMSRKRDPRFRALAAAGR